MILHGIYRLSNGEWQKVTDCKAEGFREYPMALGVDRDGHLWMACGDSRGTDFLSLRSGKWELACSFPEDRRTDIINCFTVDRAKRVWVGTEHYGLLVWEDGRWHRLSERDCSLFDCTIRSMTVDEFDNLWIGTSCGFAVFDGARWHAWATVLPESSQRPLSEQELQDLQEETRSRLVRLGGPMAIDSLGRKWIGCGKGIILFSPETAG